MKSPTPVSTRGNTIKFHETLLDNTRAYHPEDGRMNSSLHQNRVHTSLDYDFMWTFLGDTEIVVRGIAQGQTIADSEAADDHATSTGIIVT